jgi:hypothetical protein
MPTTAKFTGANGGNHDLSISVAAAMIKIKKRHHQRDGRKG